MLRVRMVRARPGVAFTVSRVGSGTVAVTQVRSRMESKMACAASGSIELSADAAANDFADGGKHLFIDPWQARNDSIELVLDPQGSRDAFLLRMRDDHWHEGSMSGTDAPGTAAKLASDVHQLRLVLSEIPALKRSSAEVCARLIDLSTQLGLAPPRKQFLELLSEAKRTALQWETGADIYLRYAETQSPGSLSVGNAEVKFHESESCCDKAKPPRARNVRKRKQNTTARAKPKSRTNSAKGQPKPGSDSIELPRSTGSSV